MIQTPAGQLGQIVSPKALLLGANISCAVLSTLIPLAAKGGWFLICVIRVLQGLSQVCFVDGCNLYKYNKCLSPCTLNSYI